MTWIAKGAGILALAVTIGGCGGSSSNDSSSSEATSDELVTLSGRAAVGAPIANATVEVRCEGGTGFTENVETDAAGGFRGQVASTALPCALRVHGGTEYEMLHSYAGSSGTVNITPFTDLIIALASARDPETWFQQEDYAIVADNLNQAKSEFLQALAQASYDIPADDFDPFHSSFVIGDAVDRLLDAFSQAARDVVNIAFYQELVDVISSGNLESIPPAPQSSGDGGSGDGNGGGDGGGNGGDGGTGGGDGDTDGGDGGSTDQACYTPQTRPAGTIIEFEQQLYDTATGEAMVVLRFRQELLGSMDFRGENTQAIFIEDLTPGVIDPGYTTYVSVDSSAMLERTHGSTSTDSITGAEYTNWFEPTFNYPYGLAVGETYDQVVANYLSTDGGPGVLMFQLNSTIQFVGKETISVPAGTFEACKFLETMSESSQASTSTTASYFTVGDGIPLRSAVVTESGEIPETELITLTINGVQELP
ncbi:carboxypeptidase-like regulatory domain-containing protein [Marinobacter sp.]|uniref:carboxypeptidase-like regulatory domain-containing protein n=1 Tax=Marinobacter sp. TaxID=50741 RepID=UPI0035695FCF